MSRARDVADTQDNVGGAVAPFVAGKNIVINGGMDYWQRGTSFTALGNVYTADRWNVYNTGTGGAYTASRVSSWLNGFDYAFRLQRNSGATSTGGTYLSMAFEGSEFVRFTGGKVTFSFYARKGADYSPTSSNWNVFLQIGTDANGALYTGLTGGINVIDQNVVLTTGGTRYSFTFDVPSGYRACRLQMSMFGVGTAGTNDWMEITGVQMEQGSVATPFARAGGSIGGELALCQRYYIRYNGGSTTGANYQVAGNAISSTTIDSYFQLPVTLRSTPSSIDFTNLGIYRVNNGTIYNSGGWYLETSSTGNTFSARYIHGSAVFTQGTDSTILVTGSNGASYLGFSAEL